MPVLLHGPFYSTYTRTARLALEEKGVAYDLHEVAIAVGLGRTAEHLARHPWGKVPVLEHGSFALYETVAITRYVDEAFPGPPLMPVAPQRRARVAQICSILDSYGWSPMVMTVFVQRVTVPRRGGTPDEAAIGTAVPRCERVLAAVEALMDGEEFLIGDSVSVADLHLVPIIDYFARTPEGHVALLRRPRLVAWWRRIEGRSSVIRTRPALG